MFYITTKYIDVCYFTCKLKIINSINNKNRFLKKLHVIFIHK